MHWGGKEEGVQDDHVGDEVELEKRHQLSVIYLGCWVSDGWVIRGLSGIMMARRVPKRRAGHGG